MLTLEGLETGKVVNQRIVVKKYNAKNKKP